MKELWSILLEKVKQVEANEAAIGIGIFSIIAMLLTTVVICKFFTMITKIVELLNQSGAKY